MMKCFDVGLRAMGPVRTSPSTDLFTYILHKISDDGSFLRYFHLAIAFTLIINVLYNYIATVLTPPGFPTDEYVELKILQWTSKREQQRRFSFTSMGSEGGARNVGEQNLHALTIARYAGGERMLEGLVVSWEEGLTSSQVRFKDGSPLPYCSNLSSCSVVIGHPAWVAQCVGFRNYRTFFLFMFWLWVGCIYVLLTMAPSFLHHFRTVRGDGKFAQSHLLTLSAEEAQSRANGCRVLLYSCVLGVSCSRTTIEWYNNRMRSAEAKKAGMSEDNYVLSHRLLVLVLATFPRPARPPPPSLQSSSLVVCHHLVPSPSSLLSPSLSHFSAVVTAILFFGSFLHCLLPWATVARSPTATQGSWQEEEEDEEEEEEETCKTVRARHLGRRQQSLTCRASQGKRSRRDGAAGSSGASGGDSITEFLEIKKGRSQGATKSIGTRTRRTRAWGKISARWRLQLGKEDEDEDEDEEERGGGGRSTKRSRAKKSTYTGIEGFIAFSSSWMSWFVVTGTQSQK
eukprot:761489-Hanusia_phi.AAC.1